MSNVDLSAALNATTVSSTSEDAKDTAKQKRNRAKALPFPALAEGKRMYRADVQVDVVKESMPPSKMFVDDLDFHKTQINYANALIAFAQAKVEELSKISREDRIAAKKATVNKERAANALKSKAVRDEFAKNPLAAVDILKSIGASPEQLLAIQEQINAMLAGGAVN